MIDILLFIITGIYHTICFLVKLLPCPIVKLYKWIKDRLEYTDVGLTLSDWNDTFSWFNGLLPFCLFIISGIYTVIMLCIAACTEGGMNAFLETIIFNTPVGSFLGFFNDGLNFTPATIVSIAFTGAICAACLGKPEDVGYVSHTLRYIVFWVATSHLAVQLTGLFQIIGDWSYNTIVTLFQAETNAFFPTLGKVLAIIVLCYPALQLVLLALKEYSEATIYGIIFLLIGIVLSLLLQFVINCSETAETIIMDVYYSIGFFGIAVFRSWFDTILDSFLFEHSPYSEKFLENICSE